MPDDIYQDLADVSRLPLVIAPLEHLCKRRRGRGRGSGRRAPLFVKVDATGSRIMEPRIALEPDRPPPRTTFVDAIGYVLRIWRHYRLFLFFALPKPSRTPSRASVHSTLAASSCGTGHWRLVALGLSKRMCVVPERPIRIPTVGSVAHTSNSRHLALKLADMARKHHNKKKEQGLQARSAQASKHASKQTLLTMRSNSSPPAKDSSTT